VAFTSSLIPFLEVLKMYAVIRTGGKQYTVKPGDVLQVEKIDQKLGAEFNIDEVLVVGGDETHIGEPLVKNASVTVVVTKQAKGPKVIVFKKKRRQGFRKFKNHKQPFTELFVKTITSPEGKSETTDLQAKVVDVAQVRQQRIEDKVAARKARTEARLKGGSTEEEPKKAAAKKKTVKKVAKKATAVKKTAKKTAAKKTGAKKASKKTTK